MQGCKHSVRSGQFTAFTIVELLVVVTILSLLAAILFPVFAAARANARRTVCISQLRQIGLSLTLYRQDYEELPPHLSTLYPAYSSDARIFVCPSDRKQGQFAGNTRLEGNSLLASGVSYDYTPNWGVAQQLGWWKPAPHYGSGKWEEMTPVADCPWHWATTFNPDWSENAKGSHGWQLLLLLSGSVRKIRIEKPMELFTPDDLH